MQSRGSRDRQYNRQVNGSYRGIQCFICSINQYSNHARSRQFIYNPSCSRRPPSAASVDKWQSGSVSSSFFRPNTSVFGSNLCPWQQSQLHIVLCDPPHWDAGMRLRDCVNAAILSGRQVAVQSQRQTLVYRRVRNDRYESLSNGPLDSLVRMSVSSHKFVRRNVDCTFRIVLFLFLEG